MSIPWFAKLGIASTQMAFKLGLPIKGIVKQTLYKQFCGGETLEEAQHTAEKLSAHHVSVILDYGVEAKASEEEFEHTTEAFLNTIHFAASKDYIPFVSLKITGFARFALLEKIHEQKPLNTEEEKEALRVLARIDKICLLASQKNTAILIDAEESWIQQAVDDLADNMMEKYNKEKAVVYNTFQLYRHDRLAFMQKSHQKALQGKYILGSKIVRGAYMEKERNRAADLGYEDPIQASKQDTDRDFNEAATYCIKHIDTIALFIGTHNEWSCLKIVNDIIKNGIAKNHHHIHFSQLYGMSDNITFNLAKEHFNVSKYLPYGPVKDVIPYLMRRAQENTSVAGQTNRELNLINKEVARRKHGDS
ncbi:MAG: proline dehydrogenase family protein [Chitinophagaceae bacterium]